MPTVSSFSYKTNSSLSSGLKNVFSEILYTVFRITRWSGAIQIQWVICRLMCVLVVRYGLIYIQLFKNVLKLSDNLCVPVTRSNIHDSLNISFHHRNPWSKDRCILWVLYAFFGVISKNGVLVRWRMFCIVRKLSSAGHSVIYLRRVKFSKYTPIGKSVLRTLRVAAINISNIG